LERLAALNRTPSWIIETEQRLRLSMGANWQTLRPGFVIKTVSAAVEHVPNDLFGLFGFFDRDDLNTHWHGLLAFKAAAI